MIENEETEEEIRQKVDAAMDVLWRYPGVFLTEAANRNPTLAKFVCNNLAFGLKVSRVLSPEDVYALAERIEATVRYEVEHGAPPLAFVDLGRILDELGISLRKLPEPTVRKTAEDYDLRRKLNELREIGTLLAEDLIITMRDKIPPVMKEHVDRWHRAKTG